jgi:putative cardiolipin synthase
MQVSNARNFDFEHMNRAAYALIIASLLAAGCATLPGADYPKQASEAIAASETGTLGKKLGAWSKSEEGPSGFQLLADGVNGFLLRAELVGVSERTLDIQCFIFQNYETGTLLVDALSRAADRSVRVRLLVDDAEDVTKNRMLAALSAHPNIEVRVFNPFILRGPLSIFRYVEYPLTAARVNYRMHNKLFIADNSIAILGGRNIGDEYFQASRSTGFADYDVAAVGPVVRQLSRTFDYYWNSDLAIPIQALTHGAPTLAVSHSPDRASPSAGGATHGDGAKLKELLETGEPLATILGSVPAFVRANAEVLYDTPEKREVEAGQKDGPLMRRSLVAAIDGVSSELMITSPYVVPGEGGMKLVERVRARGARVRIVTNSLEATEMPIAHAGYEHYRTRLLEDGVELCEMRAVPGDSSGTSTDTGSAPRAALHAKLYVLDRKRVFVGSMNFDRRSLRLNTEIGLLIDSPELAQQVAAHIDEIARPANCYVPVLGQTVLGQPTLTWRTEQDGKPLVLHIEPMGDLLRGIKTEFLSLLPIDDML